MRDCVATLEINSTRSICIGQKAEKSGPVRTGPRKKRAAIERLLFASSSGNVSVFLVEAFHASGGVHEFLLASEKRMAARADLDAQHVALDGRAGLERMPAGTVHGYSVIVGMNTGFHDSPFCRVRSARHPDGQETTAASLGHDAIYDYKLNEGQRKISLVAKRSALKIRQDAGTTATT